MSSENVNRKCEGCGRLFTPDPSNAYHQKFCGRAACERKRDRVYQNQRRKERRKSDRAFAASADARSSESRRRRKALDRAAAASARRDADYARKAEDARRLTTDLTAACLVGLVCGMGESSDPVEVARIFANMAEKGRSLMPETLSRGCQSRLFSGTGGGGGVNQDTDSMNIAFHRRGSPTKRGGCQSRHISDPPSPAQ